MKSAIVVLMALVLVTLASIVPWADAQQKPSNVLIWCQNTNGTSSPCVAGNSLDYDSGGGTVNQSTIGLVFPASGGPVAAPGNATDGLLVNLGANNDVTVTSGTVTANAGTNLNTSALLTTSAHDAAFGTAGSADSQVRTVQGIASMTPLQVQSNSANLATEATVGGLLTSATFTGRLPTAFSSADNIAAQTATALHGLTYIWDGANWDRWTGAVTQSGTWNITNISGTVSLPTGAATAALQDGIIKDGTGDTTQANVSGGNVHVALQTAIPAGSNTIGNVGVLPVTSGGTTPCYITSAASTNATNCKNAAGQLYGYDLVNTTTTIYYLRLYNLSTAPTCSSATGFVRTIPIPPAAAVGGAGGIARAIPAGEAYGTGLGFCLTGGGSSTDNTNAATGVYVSLNYK